MKKIGSLFAVVGLLVALVTFSTSLPVSATGTPEGLCGEKQLFDLVAGQTIPVGKITVANDGDTLYVVYRTNSLENWYLTEAHLYVLTSEPTGRLTPGQAPYKWEGTGGPVDTYIFEVPLDVECGTTLWIQAHASVVKIVDGQVVQSETAYGGTIHDGSPWYGNIEYTVQCCEDESCYEFVDETAWAAGNRYVTRGNWATYAPYVSDSTVTLYAGQTMAAGTVHFSAPDDGDVTITINLSGDWEFAPVSENVKIQDYASAPSGNPSPGLFEHKGTASGTYFSIVVPENNFYGVHADVGYWIETVCPVE